MKNQKRGKRKDGNLATFADHHCIERNNPIESEMMLESLGELKREIESKRMMINES